MTFAHNGKPRLIQWKEWFGPAWTTAFLLAYRPGATVMDMAAERNLNPETIRRHIRTIDEAGFLERDGARLRLIGDALASMNPRGGPHES